MFNFGAYPKIFNVSYKASYARNMYESLLVLVGSTKIVILSYAYSIHMYCIPLLLATGKLPFKYVYTFPVSGFASPIASNTLLLFSSLWGKKSVFISSASCPLFVDLYFPFVDPNVPKQLLLILESVQQFNI